MQIMLELLAAAVIAVSAAALSLFGVALDTEAPQRAELIRKTPIHTNVLVVTPAPQHAAEPQPC